MLDTQTISLVISVIALLGSLFATLFQMQKDRFALRGQLTDVNGKINEALREMVRIAAQQSATPVAAPPQPGSPTLPSSSGDNIAAVNTGGYVTEQLYGLASLGRFIAERIPRLVTDYDEVLIARGFRNAGIIGVATEYYQRALGKVTTPEFKIFVLREIANHLYLALKPANEGAALYRQALAVPLTDAIQKQTFDLQTYQHWITTLGNIFAYDGALAVLDEAIRYASGIPDQTRRSTWTNSLNSYRATVQNARALAVAQGINLYAR